MKSDSVFITRALENNYFNSCTTTIGYLSIIDYTYLLNNSSKIGKKEHLFVMKAIINGDILLLKGSRFSAKSVPDFKMEIKKEYLLWGPQFSLQLLS